MDEEKELTWREKFEQEIIKRGGKIDYSKAGQTEILVKKVITKPKAIIMQRFRKDDVNKENPEEIRIEKPTPEENMTWEQKIKTEEEKQSWKSNDEFCNYRMTFIMEEQVKWEKDKEQPKEIGRTEIDTGK